MPKPTHDELPLHRRTTSDMAAGKRGISQQRYTMIDFVQYVGLEAIEKTVFLMHREAPQWMVG